MSLVGSFIMTVIDRVIKLPSTLALLKGYPDWCYYQLWAVAMIGSNLFASQKYFTVWYLCTVQIIIPINRFNRYIFQDPSDWTDSIILTKWFNMILWFIWGGDITPKKVFLDIPRSSTNKSPTAKYIRPIILYIRTLWFCSKVRSYKLSQSSMPLYLTLDPIGCLGVRWILAGSPGCMVSCLPGYTIIRLPWDSTSSIHGLWSLGYKIACYQGIQVPRLNLIC